MSAATGPTPVGPLGIVMLCHTALDRAAQVARHWASAGCPVVLHVDRAVPRADVERCKSALADVRLVQFSRQLRCEWGGWGLVAATQVACEQLLASAPQVQHVYLASGACLPLRPIADLIAYLKARPNVDFIESTTTADVPWTKGGLDAERFTLFFPFSWRRHRRLFDRTVALQRRLGIKRVLPTGIAPHMGSQWWCLTRQTLSRILADPRRPEFDVYFKRVWIPDESYFQTLARLHARDIDSRSLTLSTFDFQGKPHVFYDDHLPLLQASHCFVARKIWPRADRLYQNFLSQPKAARKDIDPAPTQVTELFARAKERRTRGRFGLTMQSRHHQDDWKNSETAEKYHIFSGFSEVFEGFEPWLRTATGMTVHGHLFAPDRVWFARGQSHFAGALSDSAALRDANPRDFLTNLIWNTRGHQQCFQFGPHDTQDVLWDIAKDPNASIRVVSGAWTLPLFKSNQNVSDIRHEAARLQKIEADMLQAFRSPHAKACVKICTLADFLTDPSGYLNSAFEAGTPSQMLRRRIPPPLVDLTGLCAFLENLKNQGMPVYLAGDVREPQISRASAHAKYRHVSLGR